MNWRLFDTDAKNALGTLRALLRDKRFTQQFLKKNSIVRTALKGLEKFLNWTGEPAQKPASPAPIPAPKPAEGTPDGFVCYDFGNAKLFKGTVPVNCSVGGQDINAKNWGQTLVRLTELMLFSHSDAMASLYETSLDGKKGHPYLMNKKLDGLNCKELSNGYWICLNFSLPDLVKMIARLATHCGYSRDEIKLYGIAKKPAAGNTQQTTMPEKVPDPNAPKEVYHNPAYEVILTESFANGIRVENTLSLKKFRKNYAEKHGMALEASDDEIRTEIKKLCITHDTWSYHPDTMVKPDLQEKIFARIASAFASGIATLYYQALYDEFQKELAFSQIKNADMLKAWLTFVNTGKYYVQESFLSQGARVKVTPVEEIRAFIKAQGQPVKDEAVCKALPHLPAEDVKKIIRTEPEFIWNHSNEHYHISALQISDAALVYIDKLILQTIDESGYMVDQELWNILQIKQPQIAEEHPWLTLSGLRLALKELLPDNYVFSGNLISKDGRNAIEILKEFARSRDTFTLAEYLVLAEYCEQYSKRFNLIHPGYSQDACVGAIVRRDCKIENMDRLLAVLLANSDVVLQKEPRPVYYKELDIPLYCCTASRAGRFPLLDSYNCHIQPTQGYCV